MAPICVQRVAQSSLSDGERQQNLTQLLQHYQAEFTYYESDQLIQLRGREVQGLALPSEVLHKFYTANAEQWYPGVLEA